MLWLLLIIHLLDIFFLEIRSFDGEFEEAQSQSGMGQTAEELANLAKLQKQIIVATWRLDRESDETAVADDIRAVAEAQGELGETAARAAERIRGRGRERVAGNSGPAPEHLAMEAAVKAMADAAAALLELHTGAAIRSEMEALDQASSWEDVEEDAGRRLTLHFKKMSTWLTYHAVYRAAFGITPVTPSA